jgi:hypothetical protein
VIQPRTLFLFVIFAVALARIVQAAEPAPVKNAAPSLCRFDPPARSVQAFDDIPQPIRQVFLEKVGGTGAIALTSDEPVNLTDIIMSDTEKRRLFRDAARRDRRWAVFYFIGGEAVFVRAGLFELTGDDAKLSLTRNVSAKYYGGDAGEKSVEMLCAGVKSFLAGEPDLPDTLADHDVW